MDNSSQHPTPKIPILGVFIILLIVIKCEVKKIICVKWDFSEYYIIQQQHFETLYVSGKLPTNPSPKPTFCSKWEVIVNVGLGEG